MDRFFRVRVFLVFVTLGVAFALLAFLTPTRSFADTGPSQQVKVDNAPLHLIGTSADPMDTMGIGAEAQNGTSSLPS